MDEDPGGGGGADRWRADCVVQPVLLNVGGQMDTVGGIIVDGPTGGYPSQPSQSSSSRGGRGGRGLRAAAQGPEWLQPTELSRQLAQARRSGQHQRVRALLTKVAEDNYELRHRWRVPETQMVTHAECLRYPVAKGHAPVVSFSGMTTADALLYFSRDRSQPVCGLNFANGATVGGGYKHGATAQEEDLCRRIPQLYTTLLHASRRGLYPFGPCTCTSPDKPERYSDVLYTSELVVARGGEEDGFRMLPQEKQARVSLVTAAAPNVRFASEVDRPELVSRSLRSIFVAPKLLEPKLTTLVLGAWGCGAFGGNPERMSDLFVQALTKENLGGLYREVHFAIPSFSDRGVNYRAFRGAFTRHGLRVVDL